MDCKRCGLDHKGNCLRNALEHLEKLEGDYDTALEWHIELTEQFASARAYVEQLETENQRLHAALEELYKGLMFLVNQKLITVMPTETLLELAGGVRRALIV